MFLPRVSNNPLKSTIIIFFISILFFGSRISINQLLLTVEPIRQYAQDWDSRDASVRLKQDIPERIDIPWDDYEQDLGSIRLYYQTR